ncbi:MAG: hypothetical protein NC177_16575 [Ruminococcus flavefaciens]|nr:hypothetical protein [Ruminococcus flavefaciens]
MKAMTLTDNSKQIDNADAAIKAIHDKKRKLIEQSKVIAYTMLSDLYQLEGQELVDAINKEHTLISKFTASGMSYDEIESFVDGSADEVSADNADNSSVDDTYEQISFYGSDHAYTD